MTDLVSFPIARWDHACSFREQEQAQGALERGGVLLFPQLEFKLHEHEARLLSPASGGKGKNISFDRDTGRLRAKGVDDTWHATIKAMMQRFATSSGALLCGLLPSYDSDLRQARTSFRPVEIAGRTPSWRKDDSRLHVDSFPSSPTQGRRILRVFCNINPLGQDRVWRLGESFEAVAHRFVPTMSEPIPGSSGFLMLLGATRTRRSTYDHFMLQLHDRMKADMSYQANAAQRLLAFAPGSTWCVFTDQVSHAAMTGQHALEQTFHLPVHRMREPIRAPLRVLERILGRTLT